MSHKKGKIKTIFIGTPDFSVPSLRALIEDAQFDIMAVVTQPDKKVGRKQIITPPPVKVEALKYNIPVFQPDKILNLKSEILNLKPDIIIVMAYAQIMPENMLKIPKYGCINVHASLLPKYRGASCIQAAILNGDKETGVTIMKMDKGLDTGPILAQKSVNISSSDTAGTLYRKLSELGAETLTPTIKEYISGKIAPQGQDNSIANYIGLLKKEDGKIDWKKTAALLERFIRAMNPWPGAFASLKIKNNYLLLKIIEVEHRPIKINNYKIGEIFLYGNDIAVQCGQDSLIIKKLQLEGKKAMTSKEFLLGNKELIGQILT
jgi:methionyl-tRNA formyltransferase